MDMSYGIPKQLAKKITLSDDMRSIEFDFEDLNLIDMGIPEGLKHINIRLDDGQERDTLPQYTLPIYLTQAESES